MNKFTKASKHTKAAIRALEGALKKLKKREGDRFLFNSAIIFVEEAKKEIDLKEIK